MNEAQERSIEAYNYTAGRWNELKGKLLANLPMAPVAIGKMNEELDALAGMVMACWLLIEEVVGPEEVAKMGLPEGHGPAVIDGQGRVIAFAIFKKVA